MNVDEATLYSKTIARQQVAFKLYLEPYLSVNDYDNILDVGCGSGDIVYDMAGSANSATGFDKSRDMIHVARQKYQPLRTNLSYEIADITNCLQIFPNWRGAFNKILSVLVLHWVEEKRKAFQSMYECLSENGTCFLLFAGPRHQLLGSGKTELPYFLENHEKWKQHLKGYEHKIHNQLTLEENTELLKSVGFEEVHGDLNTPCDELEIFSKEQLKSYVCTLVGHVNYVPEQYRSEIVHDATEWCYQHFPVNQRGNKYYTLDIIVLRATKTKKTQSG
ncbi:juvenile hormone acid O-methyltransferase-like [Antedon mediterranea]|uniref:juvenile hormone acid O-methyltransferase-like n=1 Tax=Antedon mediterranea TaxID=105859 RepID=UPI003AF4A245